MWHPLDIQFSNMLVSTIFPTHENHDRIKKIVLMLASSYLSANIRSGHTCLHLSTLSTNTPLKNYFFNITNTEVQKLKLLNIDDWKNLLHSSSAVGTGFPTSPLVLENNRLYLHRMWKDECIVAKFLSYSSNNFEVFQKKNIINILNQLFPKTSTNINWHKIATAMSLIHSRVFISGGPGTGKTSIISKIIIALLLQDSNLRIQTAATTGKSTIILTNSCQNIINKIMQFNPTHIYKPILNAVTLHRLLGSRLYNKKNQYNSFENFLNLDCLIIDESSMLSLSILSKLISSLPRHTKVIFLGDHHQLCSIEPGSIFKDICQFSNFDYSPQQKYKLMELTGFIPNKINNSKIYQNYNNIADKICVLKKNYRFKKSSGIGKLADAVKSGNYNLSLSILNSKIYTDLNYNRIIQQKDYKSMIIDSTKQYYKYLQILKHNPISIINILQVFNNYRILCALKHGLFGVTTLNYYVEQILNYLGLIKLNQSPNYIGKPIIILSNDLSLELYNGDIGILLLNSQNNLSAYFLASAHTVKIIPIHQLPSHETCFAMTVHKAQGSEFQNISIILPNKHLPILTRELIYTAITRIHQHLSLYATDDVLINSIKNITKRHSGLYDKIKKYSTL